MDKKLLNIYENILTANEVLIEKGKFSGTTCFVIAKDYKIILMALVFSDPFEKSMMREKMKEFIMKIGAKAYIFVSDVKMTMIKVDTNEMESFDACLNSIYTPKEKITKIFIYKDRKITGRQEELTRKNSADEWDIWNEYDKSLTEEQLENYRKFKKENKAEYKDV